MDQPRPLRSPWLGAAAILMLLTFGFVGIYAALEQPSSKGKFVWWVAFPAMFGIFGAMVLAVIGLQDLSRQRSQRRPTPATVSADAADLAHRWGRTIFGGGARLAVLCWVLTIGLFLASGIPILDGLVVGMLMGLALAILVALVALVLYLLVVGPRVAYFTIARFFGRGGLPLPDQEVQAKRTTTRPAHAANLQGTAGAGQEQVTIRPDAILPEPLPEEPAQP